MNRGDLRFHWVRASLVAFLLFALSMAFDAVGQSGDAKVKFSIPRQSAAKALELYAKQAGIQVLFPHDQVASVQTSEVTGEYTRGEALSKLLSGTGLSAIFTGGDTVVVKPRVDERKAGVPSGASVTSQPMLAQAQRLDQPGGSDSLDSSVGTAEKKRRGIEGPTPQASEKITVTGTNIRGVTDSASPFITYSREDIERMGAGTVQEFIQRLPQNFSGGATEGVIAANGNGNVVNIVQGSGVNLRGLGNDSTLVLVNGRRIAPGNTNGDFVSAWMLYRMGPLLSTAPTPSEAS